MESYMAAHWIFEQSVCLHLADSWCLLGFLVPPLREIKLTGCLQKLYADERFFTVVTRNKSRLILVYNLKLPLVDLV